MRIRTIAELAVVLLVLTLLGAASTAQGAAEPGVVHFTAAGDLGATSNTANVLDGMKGQAPDLALALGDLSYGATGAEQTWCDFVTSHLGAGFPFELVAGNHESNGQNGNINDFSACLPNQLPGVIGTYGRQYYVDVPAGNPLVRFVMISPNLPFPDGTWSYAAGTPRYNWTAAAIDGARTAGIPWVVVSMHEPCWSLGQYNCPVGGDLGNLLISKRVDLVLTGHEHLYQRTKQLTTGGSCPAVPVNSFNAACVADSDSSLVQGAGTVFATVGTGGVESRSVNTADPEVGDFAAWSGSNANPAYGFLDVKATTDSLTAQFVPVGTGTFTDSFVINRGTPPPNQPPVAAFTASSQGLTASFDASGSTDPDGSIASYAWDFGDNSAAGSGVKPQHTYAAAGAYQVTLTVKDGANAEGTVTQPVTVQEQQGPVAFASDSFDRTVDNGLGTADVGGAWSTSGSSSDFSVAQQAAAVRLGAARSQRSCWLGSVSSTDTDLRLTLSLDKVPNGSGAYLDVVGRRVGTNNEYRARMVMSASGRIVVQLTALKGSSSPTAIANPVTLPSSIGYSAGSQLNVRMQVTGTSPTTVRLKVWPATDSEPTDWQTSGTDSTAALQNPGGVGLTAYLSSSVTNSPVTVRMSDLSAQPTA